MQQIENKDPLRSRKRVRPNPHIEKHGNRALEWSYHFPIQTQCRIEAELDLAFAGGKVSGAAREALTRANLINTRLSLADTAEEICPLSLRLFVDSTWVISKINLSESQSEGELLNIRIQNAPKYLKHRAKEYWSEFLFSKLGLVLQSELKSSSKKTIDFLQNLDASKSNDWTKLARQKRKMLSALRAAIRFVEIRQQWESMELQRKYSNENSQQSDLPNNAHEFEKCLSEIKILSEFALVIICKYLAEVQEYMIKTLKKCEESKSFILHSEDIPNIHKEGTQQNIETAVNKLKQESIWFENWAKILFELRQKCGLSSLAEICLDPNIATQYFERVLELKRHYYQAWDVITELNSNDSRIDFWLGSVAAGISAFFAFIATYAITVYMMQGQNLAFSTTSIIALSVFAIANVIIYVLKDRIKELIKIKARKFLSTGRFIGNCYFNLPQESGVAQTNKISIAQVVRKNWWRQGREHWHFRIFEEYQINNNTSNIPAKIIKQIWRLPLDEILDTLDDSSHIIKLPVLSGAPQEIPVLKRVVFPFHLSVAIWSKQGKRDIITDQAKLAGNVIVLGGKIVEIE